ncbi:hypothetical protein CTI12_AA589490 [Artemisia annua]|uniref:HAT C-terminal dimerisation domain-containing protein n=1 Tax=Artemisia annua TaxID=35608 RepID=A0A2U1KL84_ARTAN|nr:hypothetical protein CTI12_AA589490 [Artemisia annua]
MYVLCIQNYQRNSHVPIENLFQGFNYKTLNPKGFSRNQLVCQLETFQVERINNAKLSEVATLSYLCQTLVETGKNSMYDLVERVCRLLLTLLVSTATTERGFSTMKIFKNRLRNKMSDENLANNMVIYIEKGIADKFDSESIIEEFKGLKGSRKLQLPKAYVTAYH